MVVFHDRDSDDLDQLFQALANQTRRDIVARVLGGEVASISVLADRYEMSFAAVQKHVAILESAGLVSKRRSGRKRIVHGNPARLAEARQLLAELEELWHARFSQIDAVLDEHTTNEE